MALYPFRAVRVAGNRLIFQLVMVFNEGVSDGLRGASTIGGPAAKPLPGRLQVLEYAYAVARGQPPERPVVRSRDSTVQSSNPIKIFREMT